MACGIIKNIWSLSPVDNEDDDDDDREGGGGGGEGKGEGRETENLNKPLKTLNWYLSSS